MPDQQEIPPGTALPEPSAPDPGASRKARIKLTIVLLVAVAALGGWGYWTLTKPKSFTMLLLRGGTEQVAPNVFLGPYPTEEEIKQLDKARVTDVLCLLNPKIPYETQLIEDEKKLCEKYGLTIHVIPMYPFVSENEESLKQIEQVVSKSGLFYMHCYLGKHRATFAKQRVIDTLGVKVEGKPPPPSLERGPLKKVGHAIFGPLPAPAEYSLLVDPGVKRIVTLLDPGADAEVALRVNEVKEACRIQKIEWVNVPVSSDATAKDKRLLAALDEIKKSSKVTYIHALKTPDPRVDLLAKLFEEESKSLKDIK